MLEEKGGLRKGRACVDQTFALRQVVEQVPEKRKVYEPFMDLEKT